MQLFLKTSIRNQGCNIMEYHRISLKQLLDNNRESENRRSDFGKYK